MNFEFPWIIYWYTALTIHTKSVAEVKWDRLESGLLLNLIPTLSMAKVFHSVHGLLALEPKCPLLIDLPGDC